MSVVDDCAKAIWTEAVIVGIATRFWPRERADVRAWYVGVATMAMRRWSAGVRATDAAALALAEAIWTECPLLSVTDAVTFADVGDGVRDWYCRAALAALTFCDQRSIKEVRS